MRYEYNLETGEMTEHEDAPIIHVDPIEITTVSMRQCRLALLQENLLDDVEALITTREQHIWWDYSTQVDKYNSMTQEIANALNWTPEFLTQLFELASTL